MERYRTVLSRQAAADIRGAVRYIAADLQEPATAAHMLKRFEAAVSSLETMPERYALVSDGYLASLGLRSAPVGNYLFLCGQQTRPAGRGRSRSAWKTQLDPIADGNGTSIKKEGAIG